MDGRAFLFVQGTPERMNKDMSRQHWSPTESEQSHRQLTAGGPTAWAATRSALIGNPRSHSVCHGRVRPCVKGSQHMSRAHQRRQNARLIARSGRHLSVHLDHRNLHLSARIARAQTIARLIAAQQHISSNPIAAALVLDGALADILSAWAEQAGIQANNRDDILDALNARAPRMMAHVRLALMAHEPEARLAHCWAMLDALTTTSRVTKHYATRP